MKVFYFLAAFALIVILSNCLNLPQHQGPETSGTEVLRAIKSWSLGAMTLFSVIIAIVATALLIPKDIEDRTLYTILAKPVPRLDYLMGKLGGIILLISVSLLMMDALMSLVLVFRTQVLLHEILPVADSNWDQSTVNGLKSNIITQGSVLSIQVAILAIFLKSCVIAAVTLLISTFATSTLFTTVIGFLIYFIGHFQADARHIFEQHGESGQHWLQRATGAIVMVIFPDFQLFDIVDSVIQGQLVPWSVMAKLSGMCLFYIATYLITAWWVFSDKEC